MATVNAVYLALYKGNKTRNLYQKESRFLIWWENWQDGLIRKLTKGQYSHCEIMVERCEFISGSHYEQEYHYDCYSSSSRDGGVRCKEINLNKDKWDLIPLPTVTESQIKAYFDRTSGAKYDWWGTLGMVLGIKHKRSKYFCSEWCFNAIFNSEEGWRFSPNELAVIVKNTLGKR